MLINCIGVPIKCDTLKVEHIIMCFRNKNNFTETSLAGKMK